MEKRIWKGKVLPGKLGEYIRKHEQIWPEMTEALNAQGIHNYTIWNYGEEIIGYYECESLKRAEEVKKTMEVCRRWEKEMEPVMILEKEGGSQEVKQFRQVFFHP